MTSQVASSIGKSCVEQGYFRFLAMIATAVQKLATLTRFWSIAPVTNGDAKTSEQLYQFLSLDTAAGQIN